MKAMVLVSCPSLSPRWISLLISFELYLRLAFPGIPVLYPHNSKLPFPAHDRRCVRPESISYILGPRAAVNVKENRVFFLWVEKFAGRHSSALSSTLEGSLRFDKQNSGSLYMSFVLGTVLS